MTESGFASFFHEQFSRTVVMLIIVEGASQADAEDATQEAMARAWQKWDSINSPRAWVRKVAGHAYCRQARKRDRQVDSLDESTTESAVEPDLSIFADEQWVLRLLRALPPGQRAIAACFYDGLTCEEIAAVVGKPPATVRSQIRHARKALREMIDTGG